jgi:hypothetical protein
MTKQVGIVSPSCEHESNGSLHYCTLPNGVGYATTLLIALNFFLLLVPSEYVP